MSRSRFLLLLAGLCVALLASCTSGAALGSSGTVNLTQPTTPPTGSASATTTAAPGPTPVTPNGLITGMGVDDTSMTVGSLVDQRLDRGFSTGIALWQKSVNASGGLCGRSIRLLVGRSGESLPDAYVRIAGTSLGLITLASPTDAARLNDLTSADEIPALTLTGSSAHLSRTGSVVIGATEDIKTINALAYLRSKGKLLRGSTLYVVTDGSDADAAANAIAGAAWWSQVNGVTVVSRPAESPYRTFTGAGAVLVVADPAEVEKVLLTAPATVDVVTNLGGYDGALITQPAGRLLIAMPGPAFGSDNPAAAAVAKAFVASGQTDPGPNLMSGYAVAAAWGRLIVQACADRNLTHAGIAAALRTVGPASVDSLFGPSDPGLVVTSGLPATRVSSVALADPAAPAGLRPLIWLQAAPGIADYLPPR